MVDTRSSLIERVRNTQDAEGWREFVELYQPLLFSYVRKQGLTDHDARDMVQEIFSKLLRAMPKFELDHSRGRFRTWLWRIMHNVTNDWMRRLQRPTIHEVEWGDRIDQLESLAQSEPDDDWIDQQRRHILQTALTRVKARSQPQTWVCFEQYLLNHYPSNDVAKELGITTNSVYVNASRVLSRVRDQCAQYMEDLADE